MNSVVPLRVPKTAELLAARIRRQIVLGDVKEGERLPSEPELMQAYGVSRHVLREALRILESERLITVRRGAKGGAVVQAPEPEIAARHVAVLLQTRGTTLVDVQEARVPIETSAVLRLGKAENLPELIAILRELNDRAAERTRDLRVFGAYVFRFHRTLVELAGNKTLDVMMGLVSDIIERHIAARQMAGTPDEQANLMRDNERSIRANDKLLGLLEERRIADAADYWHNHLTAVAAHLAGTDRVLTVLDLWD